MPNADDLLFLLSLISDPDTIPPVVARGDGRAREDGMISRADGRRGGADDDDDDNEDDDDDEMSSWSSSSSWRRALASLPVRRRNGSRFPQRRALHSDADLSHRQSG